MAADWRLLVQNGILQDHDPGHIATFLRFCPQGAFTVTRTAERGARLLLWERHLARLAQSLHLLEYKAAPLLPPAAAAPSSSSLLEILIPSLYAGLREAFRRRDDEQELALTLYVRRSDKRLLDVCVHISSYLPLTAAKPVDVAVMGPSRMLPLAKSSQWVSVREVLEQCKPENTSEIVLSNDGMHLLEGSKTNFFVVLSTDDGVVVQTAALENGVLPGTIRQLVIEICQERKIPLKETAPCWDERLSWSEAFLTNSLSLIQPVRSIKMPVPWNSSFDPEQWSRSRWQSLRLKTNGDVTQMLQIEVIKRARSYGYSTKALLATTRDKV